MSTVHAPAAGHTSPAAATPLTWPRVMGFDLAAEVTGVALPDGTTTTIKAPKKAGKLRTLADDLNRLNHIATQTFTLLGEHEVELAVIEDYAAGIRSAAAHRLAEIGGVVRLACHRLQVPIVLVNVQHLKIYGAGKGGASKSEMATSALKRAGVEFGTEDECDAAWLRWLGLDLLGHPAFPMPELNRKVLAKIILPQLAVASC